MSEGFQYHNGDNPVRASRYKYTFASNLDGIRELLDTMSPALRQEVSQHTCRVLTTEVPYFKHCDVSFLMECAVRMEEVVYAPMELAIVEGKPLSHLIIIRKGVMVARGRVLTKGRVVGQESLYKEAPASTSVRSMTFTDASQLARGTLLDILKGYPDLLRSFALKSIQVVFKCAPHVLPCGGCTMAQCFVHTSIPHIFREEVLAYAEAVRNLQEMNLDAMEAGEDGRLPAPELDGCQPTLRVRHYMKKLRTYLMVSPEMRRRYEAAATLIQRAWARCKERKKLLEMKVLVRGEHRHCARACPPDSSAAKVRVDGDFDPDTTRRQPLQRLRLAITDDPL